MDLSVLLSPTMDDTYTVTVSKQGGRANIGSSSGPRPKAVSSISEWTHAFAIYAAVYCDRFPQEAPQLWKYLSTVRGLSAKCPQRQWLYYVREFQKQRQVARCSWGEVNCELYIMCTLPQPISSSPASRSGCPGKRPYTQKCYNRTGFCSFPNCIFRHLCTSCNGRHPASRCGDRQPASARDVGKAHQTHGHQDPVCPMQGPTPIKVHRLLTWLHGYDPTTTDYLVQGFHHGLSIKYHGPQNTRHAKNHRSALTNPELFLPNFSRILRWDASPARSRHRR